MPNQLPNRQMNTFPPEIFERLWGLRGDAAIDLVLPFTFATADATVLFQVPAGYRMLVRNVFWEVTTSLTGGTASAIGVSSSAAYPTKGSLLGGAGGDVAATLVSTGAIAKGTVGSAMGYPPRVVLPGGETILFNLITSQFTAGAGNVHIAAQLIPAS